MPSTNDPAYGVTGQPSGVISTVVFEYDDEVERQIQAVVAYDIAHPTHFNVGSIVGIPPNPPKWSIASGITGHDTLWLRDPNADGLAPGSTGSPLTGGGTTGTGPGGRTGSGSGDHDGADAAAGRGALAICITTPTAALSFHGRSIPVGESKVCVPLPAILPYLLAAGPDWQAAKGWFADASSLAALRDESRKISEIGLRERLQGVLTALIQEKSSQLPEGLELHFMGE
jgi:hypothetical protein